MRKQILQWIILYVIIGVLFSLISIGELQHSDHYAYFEDITGTLGFDEAISRFESGLIDINETNAFTFGRTDSAIWIEIPRGKVSDMESVLSVYNPTVKSAKLYMPVEENGHILYELNEAGWEHRQGETYRFLHPVFSLEKLYHSDSPAYLRLFSPYSQNYLLNYYQVSVFESHKIHVILLYGIVFGMLLGISMQILLMASKNKKKLRNSFLLYFGVMTVYQMALIGFVNLFFSGFQEWVMGHIMWIGVVALISYTWCIQQFALDRTDNRNTRYFAVVYGLNIAGILLLMAQKFVWANTYYHIVAVYTFFAVFVLTIKEYVKTQKEADLRLVRMSGIVVLAMIISAIRSAGYLPNNYFTVNLIIFSECMQAVYVMIIFRETIQKTEDEENLAKLNYKLEKERKEHFKTAFLNAQIRPHFVFNAINTSAYLCKKDSQEASKLLMSLAMYLRYSFDRSFKSPFVSIEEELESIKAYTDIEKARFPDQIDVVFDLKHKISFKMPVMSIQPLVENAIIHGIRKKQGPGIVYVSVTPVENGHEICVSDNGLGMTEEQLEEISHFELDEGKGIALNNIHSRLLDTYGEGLYIESELGKGTTVSFKVL